MFGFLGSSDSMNMNIPNSPKARKTIMHETPCQIPPSEKKQKARKNMMIATKNSLTVVRIVPSFISKNILHRFVYFARNKSRFISDFLKQGVQRVFLEFCS
jgi:hypothetical protein